MRAKVFGECGLNVLFLRQSLRLRHTGSETFREEMRRDIARCIKSLRHNRALLATADSSNREDVTPCP